MAAETWSNRTRHVLGAGALLLLTFAIYRFGGARALDQSVLQLAVAGLLVIWVALIWLDPRALPAGPAGWLLVITAGYGVTRAHVAEVHYLAMSDLGHFGMLVGFLLVILGCAADRRWQRWLIFFIIVAATAEALYALVQYVRRSGFVLDVVQPASYLGRASGTYINPNHGAWLISMGVVLGLPLALLSRETWAWRIFFGYAVAACGAGLVVTFSRGAWLGAGLALIAFSAWWLWREQKKWIGATLLALLLLGAGFGVDRAQVAMDNQGRQQHNDIRLTAIWPAAVSVWKEQPFVGVGPGHFADHYRKYRPGAYGTQSDPVRAHNDYLSLLADWGAIGLGFAVALLAVLAVPLGSRVMEAAAEGSTGRNRRALSMAAAAAGLYALTHAGTDFNLYLPANAMLMAVIMALVWVLPGDRLVSQGKMRLRWGRPAVWSLIVLLLAAGLTVHASRRFQQERQLRAALAAREDFETARQHLLAAWELCADNPETAYRLGEAHRRRSTEDVVEDDAGAREAVVWLQRAVNLNPRHPYYWIALGRTQHWLGESDAARESFRTAVAVDPQNYRVQAYHGWFLFEMGEWVESYRWISRSLFVHYHDNPVAIFYQGRVVNKLKEENQWPVEGVEDLRHRNPTLK